MSGVRENIVEMTAAQTGQIAIPQVPPVVCPQPTRPTAVPLDRLLLPVEGGEDELLKDRFLSKGGGMIICGPSGIGKSSFAMQCMIKWALGQECLGIQPARKLKSLLIQAENDDGDLAWMREGVMKGLGLNEAEREEACRNIYVCHEDGKVADAFVRETVEPLLSEVQPDLVWIDPALAYLGGDSKSQKDVGHFLRECLNPVIGAHRCGCIILHHTNKPPSGEQKIEWSGSDLAYLMNGSNEWTNWPRAILAIRSKGSHDVYELVAGKRGKHLHWKHDDGVTPKYSKHIAHAKGEGEIYWREATSSEIEGLSTICKRTGAPHKTLKDLLPLIPLNQAVEKKKVIDSAQSVGLSKERARAVIDEALAEARLFEIKQKRTGVRDAVFLSRTANPNLGLHSITPVQSSCYSGQNNTQNNNSPPEAAVVIMSPLYNKGEITTTDCQNNTKPQLSAETISLSGAPVDRPLLDRCMSNGDQPEK